MSAVKLSTAEQHIVVSNADWDTYTLFSDRIGERNIRCNYNGVDLELMTISPEHERAKHVFSLFFSVLAEEMDIDLVGFGSMTCRREDLDNGFEPDECYWIAQEPRIRGRDDIDLTRDPPPDLVVEVEMSRSFVDRLAIASRLGVPEVWRWDGQTLRVMVLGAEGQYSESANSLAFPFLPLGDLAPLLQLAIRESDAKGLRSFRAWVREKMAGGWGRTTP